MNKMTYLMLAGLSALMINACNGGSSDTITEAVTISESDKIAITTENSEQVISSVLGGSDAFDPDEYIYVIGDPADTTVAQGMLKQPNMKMVLNNVEKLKSIAQSQSMDCTYGGTITVDSNSETSGSASYNNCAMEEGVVINGNMTFSISNYNESTSSGYVTYTMNNLTLTENGVVQFSFDSIKYEFEVSNGEFIYFATTLNGKISSQEGMEFVNFKTTVRENSNGDDVYTINGFIKTACMGGWVEITTVQEIVEAYSDYCPSSGQMIIDGNGSEISITFNSDGSVTLGGAVSETLPSCDSMDTNVCSL